MVRQVPNSTIPRRENELISFYKSIPLFTRIILTLTIIISCGCHLQWMPYDWFFYHWDLLFKEYKVWVPITTFMIKGISFGFFMDIIFLYQYSSGLEQGTFFNRKGDYFYFLFLTMLSGLLVHQYLGSPFQLSSTLELAICTLWSLENRDMIVSFYFGIRFKAIYLPFVLLALEFLLSARLPLLGIFGLAFSYLYHYLTNDFVINYRWKPLKTPILIEKIFPNEAQPLYNPSGFTMTPPKEKPIGRQSDGSYQWGKGNKLGS